MRPTLTLDDDLAESLSRPARRLNGRRFKAVVNEAIRRGLGGIDDPADESLPLWNPKPVACCRASILYGSISWWMRSR
jgi:hypothetical protein